MSTIHFFGKGQAQICQMTTTRQLIICVVGIYTCFLTWGITQERVSKTSYDGERFTYFIFLNAVQAIVAALVAYVYSITTSSTVESMTRRMLPSFLRVSFLACLASPLGYASMKYLDYPLVILGKSCKLVPVLVMKFFIFGTTYPLKKYLAVLLITAGVSIFMLMDPNKNNGKKQESSLYGMFLLSLNLLMDGIINSSQDNIFKLFKISGITMMFHMNIFSFGLMIGYLIVSPYTSELVEAILFCHNHPVVIYDIVLFALTGAVGQCFIFYTLESFGSIMSVTVTVTRKMISIVLSVLWFGHNLSFIQWLAVALVFGAIAWDSISNSAPIHKEEEVLLDPYNTRDSKAKIH